MPGHRTKCYYCKESVLSRDIGLHILKKHEAELFAEKSNREDLHRSKFLSEPMMLALGTEYFFFCFADNSCIRHKLNAQTHFKGKKEQHKETVMKLREKYPVEGGTESAPAPPVLTQKEKDWLQQELIGLYQDQEDPSSKDYGMWKFDKKSVVIFRKLGILADYDELRKEYPDVFKQDDKEEEEQEEYLEEQVEEPPLVSEETEESDNCLVTPPPPYIPPPPPSASHYSVPNPKSDVYLNFNHRQPPPSYSSLKIIQSTKRPSSSGAL